MPKFMVSYLKSMYGDAATKENQFGYDWHPKILGDHSHMAMFAAMNAGKVKGMICIGQNPATSINAKLERTGLRKLEWLVVKDNWITETATFWKNAPEVKNGEVKTADIKTEVFFLPATQVAELEGTFTNTQRLLQFHHKAAEAPGDCRSDTSFSYELGKRLKKLYANSTAAARRGLEEPRLGLRARERSGAQERRAFGAEDPERDQRLFHRRSRPPLRRLRRAQGRRLDHLRVMDLFGRLSRRRENCSPTGARPTRRASPARSSSGAGRGRPTGASCTTAPRPIPRASRGAKRRSGSGGTRRRKNGSATMCRITSARNRPHDKAKPGTAGMDALPGTAPFIMRPDGLGWLFVPGGLVDGPLPTHYEPVESPVANPLYKQQTSPVYKHWKDTTATSWRRWAIRSSPTS